LPSPPAEVREGEVLLSGRDLLKATPEGLRRVRGREVGFVFQDPMTSLNPVFTVGFQIMEPLRKHMGWTANGRGPGRSSFWNWSAFPMRSAG
jgi:oligopeptide transport system ATP-binding protein